MIISASRRTDIPAFHGQWLLNRLKAGEVLVRNPGNPRQVTKIPLTPEKVDCLVFWTKDPANFLPLLPHIEEMGYNYYFLFTLNSYDKSMEMNVDKKSNIIRTFKQLSDRIGPERVIWRYDPIIITKKFTREYHFHWYGYLARNLRTFTHRCIISFVDLYRKIKPRLAPLGLITPDEKTMEEFAWMMSGTAARNGMELSACCQKIDLSRSGVKPGQCIDKKLIEKITGSTLKGRKDPGQRKACGCLESRDIGSYNTCGHNCLYCYAAAAIPAPPVTADPHSPLLGDALKRDDQIREYGKSGTLKIENPDLFPGESIFHSSSPSLFTDKP